MENIKALPGVFALVKESLSLYRRNFKKIIPIGLIVVVVGVVGQLVLSLLFPNFDTGVETFSKGPTILLFIYVLVFSIVSAIAQAISQIAFIKSSQELDLGISTNFKDLVRRSLKFFWPFVWVHILLSLIIVASAIFLIVPAIILVVYLAFSFYALINDGKKGLSAFSTSFYYVRNYFWKVFWRYFGLGLIIALIVTVVLGVIVLIVYFSGGFATDPQYITDTIKSISAMSGSNYFLSFLTGLVMSFIAYCVVLPLFLFYSYFTYKHLKELKPTPNSETDLKNSRRWFTGLSIFGLVVGFLLFALPFVIGIIFGFQNAKNRAQMSPEQSTNIQFVDNTLVQQESEFTEFSSGKVLENESYTNTKLNFSIKPPQGWLTEEQEDSVDGVLMTDASEAILTKIIQIQYYDGVIVSSDQFARLLIQEILDNASNIDRENALFAKVYIGPRLTYRTTVNKYPDGKIQYDLVTHENGVYIVTTGWANIISAEDKQILSETVSTFRTLD